MDKQAVIERLLAVVRVDLEAVVRIAKMASDEATCAESKCESKYDTRSTEASYLARGQAERVVALSRLLGFLETMAPRAFDEDTPLGVSALIELEEDDATRWIFIAPSEGGRQVEVAGVQVRVVTPKSPLGKAVIGRVVGDFVVLETPAETRQLEIVGAW